MKSPASNSHSLSRRQFLKLSAATAGGAALLSGGALPAHAASGADPDQVAAMLIDISRCAGCGNCQRACIEANDLNPSLEQLGRLSRETYTFVERFELDTGEVRSVKRQCMHCISAACASACPVAALHQSEEGPIAYYPDRCLGCRYCMVACPFNVPRFDWDDGLTPEINKCMFCIDRLREGEAPVCVSNCPSGALRFGARGELLQVAHSRLEAQPEHYVNHIFGEHEAGGTAVLYISDVPFEQLGFRADVTQEPIPAYTWQVMSKIPAVAGSLAVVLGGISLFTRRRFQGGRGHEPEWLTEPEQKTPPEEGG